VTDDGCIRVSLELLIANDRLVAGGLLRPVLSQLKMSVTIRIGRYLPSSQRRVGSASM
jgi:hypothetical protein